MRVGGDTAWDEKLAVRSASKRPAAVAGRGTVQVTIELPDLDLTVRALAASGPSWPAIQNVGYDQFAEALHKAMLPLYLEGIGVRIVSEFGWITGKVPAT